MSAEEIEPLRKRNAELEKIVLAFATSYRLHKDEDIAASKLKARLAMDTSVGDWKSAYEAMYGADVRKKVEVSNGAE